MDLSAPAPLTALLRWPHCFLIIILLPVSSSTFPSLINPSTSLRYLTSATQRDHHTPPTSWQGRKGRPRGAPWTSSAWRASSREERAVCWWSTAGRFPSTTRRTCKAPSTSAAPSWWRGDCSRTRCPSLSCCSPTARWRWVRSQKAFPGSQSTQ